MINMQAVLIANGLGVGLMVILLISNRMNSRNVFFDEKLFFIMALLTMLLCAFETATFWLDGMASAPARLLSLVLNVLLYVCNALFAFLWTVYVDYKLFEQPERISRYYPFIAIPAVIICVMALLNFFLPVFFSISPDNVYSRTSLSPLVYLVSYAYLLYGAGLVCLYRRRVQRYLFLPVVIFLTPVFIGSLLQFYFYGISLIWPSVALGVTSLYINIQNEAALVDSLTGLYNRQYLTRFLNALSQRSETSQTLSGIMLDLDSFKEINDTLGHSAGDAALRSVGKLLLQATDSSDFVARYAGDEFIILRSTRDPKEIQGLMARVRTAAEEFNRTQDLPYRISFSMGYSTFQPGADSLDDFLRRMDLRMYEEKRTHYSNELYDRRAPKR